MGRMMCDALAQYDFSFYLYFHENRGDELLKHMEMACGFIKNEGLLLNVLWKYIYSYVTDLVERDPTLTDLSQLLNKNISLYGGDIAPEIESQEELLAMLLSIKGDCPHVQLMLELARTYEAMLQTLQKTEGCSM